MPREAISSKRNPRRLSAFGEVQCWCQVDEIKTQMAGLLALLLLCWSACVPVHARTQLSVTFVASKPLALLNFIESASGTPNHSFMFQEFRKRHCAQHPQVESALSAYHRMTIQSNYRVLVPAEGVTRGREYILESIAARCSDVPSFLRGARAALTPGDYKILHETVSRVEPLYDDFVWVRFSNSLQKQLSECRTLAARSALNKRLSQVANLYASSWPQERSFVVALVPIPYKPESDKELTQYGGHSTGFLQVVEVLPDAPCEPRFDDIFHELCHALWNKRPTASETALEAHFGVRDSLLGRIAYAQLNETLPSALSEGWFLPQAIGRTRTEYWYRDPNVDKFAKALCPLLIQYINESRTLDAAFASRSLEIFKKKFPDAEHDAHLVMTDLLVLSSSTSALQDLDAKLLKHLVYMHNFRTGLVTERAKRALADERYSTVAFLLPTRESGNLAKLGLAKEVTTRISSMAKTTNRGSLQLRLNKRWFIFCFGTTPSEQVSQLLRLASETRLTESF